MADGKLAVSGKLIPQSQSGAPWNRRKFVKGATALAGAASVFGYDIFPAMADPPPETRKIRLVKFPVICLAPEYLAEEFLRLEGFNEIEYVEIDRNRGQEMIFANKADVAVAAPAEAIPDMEAGRPSVLLAGIHGGCYELFANQRVHALRDLRGKRIAVGAIGSPEYYFVASMLAYVGIDPQKEIDWVLGNSYAGTMQLFVDGKSDAFLAFPPQPQELRARKIGKVILNTGVDRPWEQYYCCMISAHTDFVARYPVATKRAVRAILKAADVCAAEPERVARYIVDKGYEKRYDFALDVLKSISYARWRTHSPEDSLRFYGLRLNEVGLIKTPPEKLIAKGTDWRYLNELRKELKA
jgi:NitT/TauT family transport system substrate-binding protein